MDPSAGFFVKSFLHVDSFATVIFEKGYEQMILLFNMVAVSSCI